MATDVFLSLQPKRAKASHIQRAYDGLSDSSFKKNRCKPGVSKGCFLEVFKYLRASKKHGTFESPDTDLFPHQHGTWNYFKAKRSQKGFLLSFPTSFLSFWLPSLTCHCNSKTPQRLYPTTNVSTVRRPRERYSRLRRVIKEPPARCFVV